MTQQTSSGGNSALAASARGYIRLSGPDSGKFLQGQVTCDMDSASQFIINNPISSIITPPIMSKSNPDHYEAKQVLQVFSSSLRPTAQFNIVKDLIDDVIKSKSPKKESTSPSLSRTDQRRSRRRSDAGLPSNSMKGPASKSPSSTCLKRIASAFPDPNSDQEHLLKNNNSLGKKLPCPDEIRSRKVPAPRCC